MFQHIVSKFLLKNEITGNPSYSRTMTVIAFLIINFKLLFSGIQFGSFVNMSSFSGLDYSACLAAIAGFHIGNKVAVKSKQEEKDGN